MASITYWNRLEPRPVAPSIAETLAARLRDPLWLLTRQWQFGEFQGEDAGSPAYVHIHAVGMPLTAWRPGAGAWRPLDNSGPIEAIAEGEAISGDDLSLQVELAEAFERLLRARADIDGPGADAVMKELVAKLPLAAPPAADAMATRFYRVCAPRSFNGVTLFTASRQNPPVLPPGSELRGITTIGTVVDNLSPDAAACGLDQAKIKSSIARILADAGFKTQPLGDEETYVWVNVVTNRMGTGTCVSRYDASLMTQADATLPYLKGLVALDVPLLRDGGLTGGAAASHAKSVLDALAASVNRFITQIRGAAK